MKDPYQILVCSSLEHDRWHDLAGPNAFESWHFDAVSDDGREAVVISFYDNYVLSPRFYTNSSTPSNVTVSGKHRFPAVSIVYSVDGETVFNSVHEYVEGDFWSAATEGCKIANSSFRRNCADYGNGILVTVDVRTVGGRRLQAEMEWLMIESDLMTEMGDSPAVWNLVAPRADVSGKILLIGNRGKIRKTVNFRGTGYHDQITSENVHYGELSSRMWGRAHFIDSTVVFERHGGVQDRSALGKVLIVRNGSISECEASCETGDYRRDRYGIYIPHKISYHLDDHMEIRITPTDVIRSGIAEVKMLADITTDSCNESPRVSRGIVEFVDPRRMKSRLSRWVSNLRIGQDGKPPLF